MITSSGSSLKSRIASADLSVNQSAVLFSRTESPVSSTFSHNKSQHQPPATTSRTWEQQKLQNANRRNYGVHASLLLFCPNFNNKEIYGTISSEQSVTVRVRTLVRIKGPICFLQRCSAWQVITEWIEWSIYFVINLGGNNWMAGGKTAFLRSDDVRRVSLISYIRVCSRHVFPAWWWYA